MSVTEENRFVKVSYAWSAGDRMIPFIRLQGRWLEEMGFAIGTRVRVTCGEGQLILRAMMPEDGKQQAR